MRHILPVAAIVLAFAFATGCSGIKVNIDYDTSVDFSEFNTFAWHESKDTSLAGENQLMHRRLVSSIEQRFEQSGMRKVTSNPDLYITYHTSSKQETQFNTTSFGYGYGGGWRWGGMGGMGGMGSSTTRATTIERGSLIIDAWDAKTKNLVWRGTVQAVVDPNPQNMTDKLEKALDKLQEEWQKKQAQRQG